MLEIQPYHASMKYVSARAVLEAIGATELDVASDMIDISCHVDSSAAFEWVPVVSTPLYYANLRSYQ